VILAPGLRQFSLQATNVSFVQLNENADAGSWADTKPGKNKETMKAANFRFIRINGWEF